MSEVVLYLFPTPIADIEINQCLPEENQKLLKLVKKKNTN